VICEAVDEQLTAAERGRLISELACRVHRDADGVQVRITSRTIYRWVETWRMGGFEALKPRRRRDAGVPRTDPQILEAAAALRREAPARSAAHIAEILERTRGVEVSARTLQRVLAARGLDRARLEGRHRAFGRFEADACGELWTADGWDGPALAELDGRHAQLFSFLDDHSRLICHGKFYRDVGEWSFQGCLREAIIRRGLPVAIYIDNGAAQSSLQLKLICARLGVRIVHSKPYRPQGPREEGTSLPHRGRTVRGRGRGHRRRHVGAAQQILGCLGRAGLPPSHPPRHRPEPAGAVDDLRVEVAAHPCA
jgi:putative transposase